MKLQVWILGAAALGMMGASAGFLRHHQSIQRLGEPGVRVVSKAIYDPEGQLAGTNSVPLPDTLLGLEGVDVPIDRTVLEWLPQDTTYAQKRYTDTNGFGMLVNVVLMGADRTSIHKPEYCLKGSGWMDHEPEETSVRVASPHPYDLPVMKVLTSKDGVLPGGGKIRVRGIYVYWFVADGELTATHGQRMWWMARDLLRTGVLQRWAYVSAFSVCEPGREDATFGRMKHMIAAMVPDIQRVTGPEVAGVGETSLNR